ncbi:hypothetical protein [Natronosalvus rutilus]|uniref:Uncharacterized protein n=1 Tax=Natronosalvus rutilus TaxID=2953753 RepID=A0A9E7NAZ9_9EURY|nr:hypothetical protein [Natronosalvus rutilus]UTF54600.1 hypothetical protein NGM29_04820 [Natronosalvus rutilus]
MAELPSPETIRERALEAGERGSDGSDEEAARGGRDRGVNLLVGPLDDTDPLADLEVAIDPETGGAVYRGPRAARAGLLAVAGTVATDEETAARLYYPDADLAADGPWLVLEPLDGRLSTVVRGQARVSVDLERAPEASANYRRLETDENRLSAVLEAAKPSHPHYPIEDDRDGVFTTGMTTFSLTAVEAGDDRLTASGEASSERLTVVFEAATTPTTAFAEVESRFESCPGVEAVRLERVADVDRARPSRATRTAVEGAHQAVLGDCAYDWLAPGSIFEAVPTPEKVALGTGAPGEPFDADAFTIGTRLLEETLARVEGSV